MISKNTERILSLGNSGTITRNSTQISSLSSPPPSNRRGGGRNRKIKLVQTKRSQLWYPCARYKRFLISLASEKKDDRVRVARARVCETRC